MANFSLVKRVSMKQLLHFTRQLSILISAGTPLIKALNTIYEQMPEGYFKEIIFGIIKNVEEGSPLSTALSENPDIFSNLFVNMVKAGEVGGLLPAVLKRMDHFLNHTYRLHQRIKLATMYPAFVLIIAIVILTVLTAFVVPSFAKIFNDLGGQLPPTTRVLISISTAFNHFWYLIPLLIFLFVILFKIAVRKPATKSFLDNLKLKLPVIGTLTLNLEIARFSRLLGTLLVSGVPILNALKLTGDASENSLFSDAIEAVLKNIEKGSNIYSSMEEHDIFPKILTRMVNVGEESGQLDKILLQIADEYEEEAEDTLTSLTALLEPLLIVTMGIIVGFVVIALFFPIFTMGSLVK
ncbi:MAG: type II secretion system F family protein [Candidatus Omnitrophica bacterium]|nr:type II secretion system F family protein [Candidatus Omnitrophota bacterium]MDD5351756.1 type II secretion system F family protein [Candidatus Omnitrophota bacterium]MDD5550967.1 type II secretion system F family protein [Candidatus Omnitrophota bacterium]